LTRESRRAGRLGLPVAEKEKEGWVGEIREIVFDVFAVVCYRTRTHVYIHMYTASNQIKRLSTLF
jgi:hypothetical protein